MAGLADLHFATSYHKGRDNIASDFYLPCMSRALGYDRAVGYFRSSIFLIAWPELRGFVERGGKYRILCSQILSEADIEALERGYSARVDESLAAHFTEEIRSLLSDNVARQPARVLAALVARGVIDLKVAILREEELRGAHGRIFHDKLGIFRDQYDNVVIFKGSMNETWSGLAADGNLESVDVAASWMGSRDLERVAREDEYFATLWENKYPTLTVHAFPAVAREQLERAADPHWEDTVERLLAEKPSLIASTQSDSRGRTLRPHQAGGLASWNANDRHGILAFVTGAGKTFTAITAIREALTVHKEPVLVVVPDRVLFAQWYTELKETTADLGAHILRAGAGHTDWRKKLQVWMSESDEPRVVLATAATARSDDFRNFLPRSSRIMLVADEVHRLGSKENSRLLDESLFSARLGLSATPERAGDPEGTARIISYFNGVLTPRYLLPDAVRDGVLTKYFYHPHTVSLSPSETTDWRDLTAQIVRLRARSASTDGLPSLNGRVDLLYMQRARIVKQASAKVSAAADIVADAYERGQRWIIYCDDTIQLDLVSSGLKARGIQNMPFHSKMAGDRDETLRWLDRRGGIVVAIRCLDEGVDIPSVTHALILASSKNPREYIQRRGRVLRRARDKSLAHIHDVLVVPPPGVDAGQYPDPVLAGELARAVEFAQWADNPTASADLQLIALEAGIEWRGLAGEGYEDADD